MVKSTQWDSSWDLEGFKCLERTHMITQVQEGRDRKAEEGMWASALV